MAFVIPDGAEEFTWTTTQTEDDGDFTSIAEDALLYDADVNTTAIDMRGNNKRGAKTTINVDPATITAISLRFYVNRHMDDGDVYAYPYTGATTVDAGEFDSVTPTAAGWWTYTGMTGTWLAALADMGGGTTGIRFTYNPSAGRVNVSEINVDVTTGGGGGVVKPPTQVLFNLSMIPWLMFGGLFRASQKNLSMTVRNFLKGKWWMI